VVPPARVWSSSALAALRRHRGEAAVLVAGTDVIGEGGGWAVGGAAVVEQGARGGVGEQAVSDAVGGDLAGHLGGDGAVADEVGGLVVGADQGGVGDDDLDHRLAGVDRP
jgi:hypothetical protein